MELNTSLPFHCQTDNMDAEWTDIKASVPREKLAVPKQCWNGPTCRHFTHGDRCRYGGRVAHLGAAAYAVALAAAAAPAAPVAPAAPAAPAVRRDVFSAAAAAGIKDAMPMTVVTPPKAKAAPKPPAAPARVSYASVASRVMPVKDLSTAFEMVADDGLTRITIDGHWGDLVE